MEALALYTLAYILIGFLIGIVYTYVNKQKNIGRYTTEGIGDQLVTSILLWPGVAIVLIVMLIGKLTSSLSSRISVTEHVVNLVKKIHEGMDKIFK
jgi:hypothetical protein